MSRAPHVIKYTPNKLREMRSLGARSLLYFCGLLGYKDVKSDLHARMCQFWQYGAWANGKKKTAKIAFRGSLKSSINRAYVLQCGLNQDVLDWYPGWSWADKPFSAMLLLNRDANAKAGIEELKSRVVANDLLWAIYQDRLPEGLKGSTTEVFRLLDANGRPYPFLTHAGVDSKLESIHVNYLDIDDPEGAEADESGAVQDAAARFVMGNLDPLLISPAHDRISVTLTPWGANPLAFRLRAMADRPGSSWSCFFQEIYDSEGKSVWPDRVPDSWCKATEEETQTSPERARMWFRQYRLMERVPQVGYRTFPEEVLGRGVFAMEGPWIDYQPPAGLPGEALRRRIKVSSGGVSMALRIPEPDAPGSDVFTRRRVHVSACHRYILMDPAHKVPDENKNNPRNSDWVMLVVAVASDWNVFVLEEAFIEEGFEVAMPKLVELYRKWRPLRWAYDAVGAQRWARTHLRALEAESLAQIYSKPWASFPTREELPRMSTRAIEFEGSGQDKRRQIETALGPWFAGGLLHVSPHVTPRLWQQLIEFDLPGSKIDGPDCLRLGAQTPPKDKDTRPVWRPPADPAYNQMAEFGQGLAGA